MTLAWGARRGGEQATEIGFTGERQDPDTGLVHLRARDMDPATGRFLGPDPVSPGVGRQANSP